MNTADILTLAKAGFTANQIAALATAIAAPEPKPELKPEPKPDPSPAQDPVQEVLVKLGVLTDAIHANGVLTGTQPKRETADDILAAIIAPPEIKKE